MKYFVKYLPIPGKLEVGCRAVLGRSTITGVIDKQDLKEIKTQKREGDYKKAAAFLCTSDLKVGDKVKFQLAPNSTRWLDCVVKEMVESENTAIITDGDMTYHTTPDECCFKVLGRISGQAEWLKQNAVILPYQLEWEFNSNIFKPMRFKFEEYPTIEIVKAKVKEYYKFKSLDRHISLRVLGPCGHFH